jgi:hypothetical protein
MPLANHTFKHIAPVVKISKSAFKYLFPAGITLSGVRIWITPWNRLLASGKRVRFKTYPDGPPLEEKNSCPDDTVLGTTITQHHRPSSLLFIT